MKIVRKLLIVVGVLLLIPFVAFATLAVSARSSDGPSGVFAGGALVAGDLVTGAEPDWSFVHDIGTIELQLLEPPRSRLIWVLDHEGKAYVVSGYMNNRIGRIWKKWPIEAERDGRAVVRIDGKRYERTLVRLMSGAVVEGVMTELSRKYGGQTTAATVESGGFWLFELAPRNSGTTGAAR
jgi:hypothetical protein